MIVSRKRPKGYHQILIFCFRQIELDTTLNNTFMFLTKMFRLQTLLYGSNLFI